MRSKAGEKAGRCLLLQTQGQYVTVQDTSLLFREVLQVMMPVRYSPSFFLSCQEVNFQHISNNSCSDSSPRTNLSNPIPHPLELYSYLSGPAGTGHSSFGSGSADCRRLLDSQTPFASSGGRVPLPDEKYQTGSENHSSSASLQVVP